MFSVGAFLWCGFLCHLSISNYLNEECKMFFLYISYVVAFYVLRLFLMMPRVGLPSVIAAFNNISH